LLQNCGSTKVEENPTVNSKEVKTEVTPEVVKPKKVATEVTWVKLDDLEATLKKEPRNVIVDVYTDWCGPCKMMDRQTFTDSTIIKIMNEDFYAVKFNAEGPDEINFQGKKWSNPNHDPERRGRNAKHELSSFFQVRGYPCLVVLDENLKIKDKLLGFKPPSALMAALEEHRN